MNKVRALLGAGFIILVSVLSNQAEAQNQTVIPQVTVGSQLQRWTGMTLGSKNVGTVAIIDASGNQIIAATAANQTSELTKLDTINTSLGTLNTTAGGAVAAGTNIIGKVGVDQTTPGTTNLVALTPAHTGAGATGSAPPANANYMGALSGSTAGGLTTGMIACDSTAIYDASTTGSTELVALSGSKIIYVCGYSIMAGGTVNVKLITGTGTACATGSSNKTPAFQLTAQAGIADGAPFFRGLKTAAGGALCINASGAVAAQAIVYYAQF